MVGCVIQESIRHKNTMPDKSLSHILMIDDDDHLCAYVKSNLEKENFSVETKNSVDKGIYVLQSSRVDLILLDVVMPKINGIQAVSALKNHKNDVPIIFLTSQSEIQMKLEGFKAGADDYVTKPFAISELIMRITAVLRRSKGNVSITKADSLSYKIGRFNFDYLTRKLMYQQEEKSLSIKEAELLKVLCDNKGNFIKRETILTHVWGKVDDYASNSMDVYLSRVRKLLKDDDSIKIENLHGTGYRILM